MSEVLGHSEGMEKEPDGTEKDSELAAKQVEENKSADALLESGISHGVDPDKMRKIIETAMENSRGSETWPSREQDR